MTVHVSEYAINCTPGPELFWQPTKIGATTNPETPTENVCFGEALSDTVKPTPKFPTAVMVPVIVSTDPVVVLRPTPGDS